MQIDDWQKILTYIQSCQHSPSISEIARQIGMHPNTVRNIMHFIGAIQWDINRIEIIQTKSSEIVRIHQSQHSDGYHRLEQKVDAILMGVTGFPRL